MKYQPRLQFEDKYNIGNKSIKEIRDLIERVEIDRDLIDALYTDSRKTTTRIAGKCENIYEKNLRWQQKYSDFKNIENQIYNKGFENIFGFYVTGLWASAGPLTICSLKLNRFTEIKGIDYSNELTFKQRKKLYEQIKNNAEYLSIKHLNSNKIDDLGLKNSIRTGYKNLKNEMRKEFNLDEEKDYFLYFKYGLEQKNSKIVQSTKKKAYILACASIIAKVERQNKMAELGKEYPSYGFENNHGYITSGHRKAVREKGFTPVHRRSFDFEKKLKLDL
jgi:ribonuclease HII